MTAHGVEELASVDTLIVQQRKEWGEILTGFETTNKYAVSTHDGKELYLAAETKGSILFRIFFKAFRPFTMYIMATDGQRIVRLERSFRVYFHKLDVFDASGKHLGTVEKRFSLLRRVYAVSDDTGQELFQLFGPLLRPWTFVIRQKSREIGSIVKRWSGILKEGFTDADNFGVMFPVELSAVHKSILLGAVFLIDFVHFENRR